MELPDFFNNSFLLYVLIFLSVTNLVGYLIMGNLNAPVYFVLIGLLASFFSKNMAFILLTALILSNLFVA
jgi:hypothetical protein